MPIRTAIILFLSAWLAVGRIWAGGSGLNVIVVVNQNSTNSVQLGNDYCELRDVPPQNVLRLTNWTGGAVNWNPSDFQNKLLDPLLSMVAGRGLGEQAQFVVLSMNIPYRVTDGSNEDSTTSALFYGFKTNSASPEQGFPSCSLPDNSSNSYAYSELPFSQAMPNTATTNSFLAMMLTDTNLAAAENTLRRGMAADSSFPTQMVYLAKTADLVRSYRFVEFDNAIFENHVAGNYAISRVDTSSMAFTNLFGLQAGLDIYSLKTNAFVPGALGDTLTSFGGYILEPSSQTPVLAFLQAGASGTYGTVVEPCAYTEKFPDPVDYFYQRRGFALAEAYYQSLLNPFEGLMVGEPLTAPYARPGNASWTSVTNGSGLSGVTNLKVDFASASTNLPLARADLFVDGTFFQTMTNLPPAPGNVASVNLNGHDINYEIPTNATLGMAAGGLAAAINLQSNVTQVVATALGDRIELQSQDIYVPGSNVTVSVGSAIGSAAALTTSVSAARPDFLDTVATGYQFVTIYNAPQVGDWLQVTVTKTNGTTVTLGVTNSVPGATAATLAQSLANLISADPSLQLADGLFVSDFFDAGLAGVQFFAYARTAGWPASQILATWNTSTNLQSDHFSASPLADNVSDLRPRDHLYVTSGTGSLAVDFDLDTTAISDGCHQLTAVAYEGTSVATQTRVTRSVVVQNTALAATLASLPVGSNATLGQQLQFTVTPNTTNILRIELFSTGGSQGWATNQSSAAFSLPASYFGLGLHPFYAIVTDQSGHQYRTATAWYRIVPVIALTLTGMPVVLTSSAVAGQSYDLQFTTNLMAGFQTVETILATNPAVQWPVTMTHQAGFYRVQLEP